MIGNESMCNRFYQLLQTLTKNATPILYGVLGLTFLFGTLYIFYLASNITSSDGRVIALYFLNITALCGSILLIWGILKRHSLTAAVVGVLLVPLYPALYIAVGSLYPQTIATTLLLLISWLFFKDPPLGKFTFFLVGAINGILVLMMPVFTVNLLVMGFWTPLRARHRKVSSLALFALGALLILTPWLMGIQTFPLFTPAEPYASSTLLNISWGFLLLFTLIRLCYFRRYPLEQFEHYILVTYLLHAFISIFFLKDARIRLSFDPLLMIICANFIGNAYKTFR